MISQTFFSQVTQLLRRFELSMRIFCSSELQKSCTRSSELWPKTMSKVFPRKDTRCCRAVVCQTCCLRLDGRRQAISVAAELYLCIDLSLRVEHLAASEQQWGTLRGFPHLRRTQMFELLYKRWDSVEHWIKALLCWTSLQQDCAAPRHGRTRDPKKRKLKTLEKEKMDPWRLTET